MKAHDSSRAEAFTVKEAAEELGISETLVRSVINGGQLTAYRYGPRKTLVYRGDLQTFKESRRIEAQINREAS